LSVRAKAHTRHFRMQEIKLQLVEKGVPINDKKR